MRLVSADGGVVPGAGAKWLAQAFALGQYDAVERAFDEDHPLFGRTVEVRKVHLVYEAKLVDPKLRAAITKAGASRGVEVHFQ